MQANLCMIDSKGNCSFRMPLSEVPEFIPEEKDEKATETVAHFGNSMSFECVFNPVYIKPRILKWLECLKYAKWNAKGQIRLRTVREVWRMCMDVQYPYRGYFNDAGHFIIEMNPRYVRAAKRKRG